MSRTANFSGNSADWPDVPSRRMNASDRPEPYQADGTVTPPGPTRTAAFFDLDKTVIAKSSASAFNKSFIEQGLLNRRAVLKSSYAQFLLLMSGADDDQIDRMRST